MQVRKDCLDPRFTEPPGCGEESSRLRRIMDYTLIIIAAAGFVVEAPTPARRPPPGTTPAARPRAYRAAALFHFDRRA